MRWFTTNKKNFVGMECTDEIKGRYVLRLTPNSNFTPEEYSTDDLRYISILHNNKPKVLDIKNYLLSLQKEYDNSIDVNAFYLNNKVMWLDKATRVGLVNMLNTQKSLGYLSTTLWFNANNITIDIDKGLELLAGIEMYAMECYNVTQKHLQEIKNLNTIDECLNYNITTGYPNKIKINV